MARPVREQELQQRVGSEHGQQHGDGDQEADEELAARAEIFERVVQQRRMAPDEPPDMRAPPEAVDAERQDREQQVPQHQHAKRAEPAVEPRRSAGRRGIR